MTRHRVTAAGLFLLVWFSCAWFGSWEFNPNQSTRMFAAFALVEEQRATIDAFAPLTIDKAEFGTHVYLDKAPGMTIAALPAVALADAVSGDRAKAHPLDQHDAGFTRYVRSRLRLAVAFGPALLTAIAAVLLFDLAAGLTGRADAALFASLGYALGTPIWGWSTTLLGHAPVAALYVVASWAVWRATRDGRTRGWLAALAGASLGWAVAIEFQAVLAGSAIGVWALTRIWPRKDRWRLIVPAMLGGIAALIPLVIYDLVAFGTVFRLGYQGVTQFTGMRRGLFGLGVPDPAVLWEIVVGTRRGLLWVAPVLVMAPIGLWHIVRARGARGIGVTAIAIVGVALLVNAAYFYWDGGNSTGPRHAMAMTGLLALGLAPFWAGLRSAAARGAAAGVLALSIAINAVVASAEIFAPPEYNFPLYGAVYALRFRAGDLRTIPSEWLGWSPWSGFALWAAIALPLIGWLAMRVRRSAG